MAKKPVSIEHVSAAISRWQTRLRRAVTMIEKLEKQRKRIEKAAARKPLPVRFEPKPALSEIEIAALCGGERAAARLAEIDTSIPAFLERKALDPVAEQIKAEQEATKRAKARGRIERMKAKQRGDLKKMPLTGRAALDAINKG
jgi:hypothetical protein